MTHINPSIFREYDIRGRVREDLSDPVVTAVASAFAALFAQHNCRKIVVGRDGRPSSPGIMDLTVQTLVRFGFDVIDIGLVPTPLMYYSVHRLQADGGLVVTASHNPPEYNGFKALLGTDALFGEQIRAVYELARSGPFPPSGAGTHTRRDMLEDYYEYITGNIHLQRPLSVVVDCGNGTAGVTAPTLYRRLGARIIPLYTEVDGTFPNHHPDPTKVENLQDLIRTVKESGAGLGIGFDGDADRIGVVDGEGHILWGDQLMIIFCRDILPKYPGGKVISEVKASETLYEEIRRLGGTPIMWKTGHSLIKKKIKDEKAVFAGEMSGHIFFNDRWFGFDDAVYAGARLLEILAASNQSLADLYRQIPRAVNTPEIREETTEEAKFKIVERVVDHFKTQNYPVIDIDGARVTFPGGWALVRASNTQPSLVLRFEARDQETLEKIRSIVTPVIREAKEQFE